MALFLFVYGTQHHCVRIGFAGERPLIYAFYSYDNQSQLPLIQGQTYRDITIGQYEWLRAHLNCDVSYISGADWPGRTGNLECRTHGAHYQLFDASPVFPDLWEERLI
jgi:hypothetical protein